MSALQLPMRFVLACDSLTSFPMVFKG